MSSSRVAGRYAQALIEMAHEENAFDSVVDDIETIGSAIKGSSDLRNLLASPIIDVRKKEHLLREIFGGKIGTIVDRFVSLLTLKGRASQLQGIVEAFHHLLDEKRNVMPATITTAVEMADEQKQRVEEQIAQLTGHSVRAEYVVDPAIIGGFRARFKDQMIDATVRHQLDRLHETLMTGGPSPN